MINMYFKYAVKQVMRRPVFNLIVVFLYVSVIILVTMAAARLDSYFVVSNTIKNVCSHDCYKIKWDTDYELTNDDKIFEISNKYGDLREPLMEQFNNNEISEAEYNRQLAELHEQQMKELEEAGVDQDCSSSPDITALPHVDKKYTFYNSSILTSTYSVDFISKDFCEDLNITMYSGEWFSWAEDDPECLELIAFSNSAYNVGDEVDLYIENNIQDRRPVNYKGKIIGLIDYSEYSPVFENASFETDDFVSFDDTLPLKDDNLLAVYSEDDPLMKEAPILEFCSMIKLSPDISDENREEFLSAAAAHNYNAVDMKEAYENTYIRDKKRFNNDVIFLSLAFMIAAVSIVGISALNVSKEIKTYSTYCLFGMTTSQCIIINAIYSVLMLGTAFILSIIAILAAAYVRYISYVNLMASTQIIDPYHYLNISYKSVAVTVLLMIVSFFASMIIPVYSLRKMQIVETIKKDN